MQQPATQAVDNQSIIEHHLTITTRVIYTNRMNVEVLVRQKHTISFRRTKNNPSEYYLQLDL